MHVSKLGLGLISRLVLFQINWVLEPTSIEIKIYIYINVIYTYIMRYIHIYNIIDL